MYDFLLYAYSWHVTHTILMLIVGLSSGILFAMGRKKKTSSVIFHVVFWLFLVYPILISPNFMEYKKGLEVCQSNASYVLVKGVCYKPVDGYIPFNSSYISKDAGDQINQVRK